MFLQRIHKMRCKIIQFCPKYQKKNVKNAYLLANFGKFMQICISLAVFIQYALSINIRMMNHPGTHEAVMSVGSASLESV